MASTTSRVCQADRLQHGAGDVALGDVAGQAGDHAAGVASASAGANRPEKAGTK